MNCLQCGTPNPENAVFCKNCGASLFRQAQEMTENNVVSGEAENVRQEAPVFEQKSAQEKDFPANSAVDLVRKWSKSTLFLTATILFTVSLGLSAVSGFFGGVVSAIFAEDAFGTGIFSISILGIMAMIGLWKIYLAGKNSIGEFNKLGFTILKVISIISIIVSAVTCGLGGLACIIVGICLPQIVELAGAQWQEMIETIQETLNAQGLYLENFDINMFFEPEFLSVLIILMGVILLIALAVSITFYANASSSISRITSMIDTGAVTKNISMFFIVLLFIFGGMNVLSFSLISACEGAAYIIYGIVLIKFKNEAEELKYAVNGTESI